MKSRQADKCIHLSSIQEVLHKSGLPPEAREAFERGLHEENRARGPSPYLEYIEPYL